MAGDRGRALREALGRVETLRGATIEQARRVVAAPNIGRRAVCVDELRRLLADLDAAEATERKVIDSFNASILGCGLLYELGAVEVNELDDRDLAPALERVPDLAEQLVGIEALGHEVRR